MLILHCTVYGYTSFTGRRNTKNNESQLIRLIFTNFRTKNLFHSVQFNGTTCNGYCINNLDFYSVFHFNQKIIDDSYMASTCIELKCWSKHELSSKWIVDFLFLLMNRNFHQSFVSSFATCFRIKWKYVFELLCSTVHLKCAT